ncbi:MAG: peptide deformylase, partial [Bacteroidales bacterium]|nr:peptide deformylase [Bacteroidales bacterium]
FSDEMMEVWDDCMSFPNLLVRVKRHKSCTLSFVDEQFKAHQWNLSDDLSELLQHESDHLNGILATQRALDDKAFWYTG